MMYGSTETATARDRSYAKSHRLAQRPPFECIALLLQGGGALGSYQAGVYEALAEADLHPDWVAGISIGAINSAIIAGNPPAERVVRSFWQEITANPLLDRAGRAKGLFVEGRFGAQAFQMGHACRGCRVSRYASLPPGSILTAPSSHAKKPEPRSPDGPTTAKDINRADSNTFRNAPQIQNVAALAGHRHGIAA
jgi:hypothetical protein